MCFFGIFIGHFNVLRFVATEEPGGSSVLRLIEVFTATDLPIHASTICLCLPRFMQYIVFIYCILQMVTFSYLTCPAYLDHIEHGNPFGLSFDLQDTMLCCQGENLYSGVAPFK